MAQHRAKRRRDVGFEPARRPFEDRPRVRVQVEIGAEAGDLRRRTVLLRRSEEGEVGPRRPDRLKARQLLAEAIRDLRQNRLERRIGGDLAALRGPGEAPHDKKRLPDDPRIGAGEERLGNRNAGRERRLKHGELVEASEARRDAARRVGAQDEALRPGEAAIREKDVEAPILLDRAAGEQLAGRDLDLFGAARPGQEARQRCDIKWRQRRGRHRPK